MTYRYIEFTDKTAVSAAGRKQGVLWYVGKPCEELVQELALEEVRRDGRDIVGYTSSLEALGEKGWELQFVTPCGVNFARRDSMAGPIENAYILKKTEA